MKKISLVIPFYNEAGVVPLFFKAVTEVTAGLTDYQFEYICVDDGSTDSTLAELLSASRQYPQITIIQLSRNFGKEAALTAGLEYATGDAVIPLDADLQHPPELIPNMLERWQAGYDVVAASRVGSPHESFFRRSASRFFYKIYNALADIPIPADLGDFRLMDRTVVDALKKLPERNRFMKGLFAWLGFKTAVLPYKPLERTAGKTKWKKRRLWRLAVEGITGFSTLPLKIFAYLGILFASLALVYGALIFSRALLLGVDVPGYASTLVAISFLGGIQLLGIGILGEYLGKTYQEAKRRPIYLVRKVYDGSMERNNVGC